MDRLHNEEKITPFMVSVAPAYDKQNTFEIMKVEPENGNKLSLQKLREVCLSHDTRVCARSQ